MKDHGDSHITTFFLDLKYMKNSTVVSFDFYVTVQILDRCKDFKGVLKRQGPCLDLLFKLPINSRISHSCNEW